MFAHSPPGIPFTSQQTKCRGHTLLCKILRAWTPPLPISLSSSPAILPVAHHTPATLTSFPSPERAEVFSSQSLCMCCFLCLRRFPPDGCTVCSLRYSDLHSSFSISKRASSLCFPKKLPASLATLFSEWGNAHPLSIFE